LRLKEDAFLRIRKRTRKKLPDTIDHDCKILYDNGAYYLVLLVDNKKMYPEKTPHNIVSLDPGVRTFQTCYSPSGVALKIGENQKHSIQILHLKIDQLKSLRDKEGKRRRKWHLKQRIRKLERKVRMVIDDLHNQTCARLIMNFKQILLPTFGTSKMLSENFLHSKTKREMASLSHFRFQEKLKGLCERNKRQLFLVDESYTTKTCGSCGFIHSNVGGSKHFKCPSCPYEMDRDHHGSRNILIKYVTDNRITTHIR
jgi:putative transposase